MWSQFPKVVLDGSDGDSTFYTNYDYYLYRWCNGIIDVDLDSENVSLVLNKATRFVVAVLLTGFGNIYAPPMILAAYPSKVEHLVPVF